jgi:hypothetical protein
MTTAFPAKRPAIMGERALWKAIMNGVTQQNSEAKGVRTVVPRDDSSDDAEGFIVDLG